MPTGVGPTTATVLHHRSPRPPIQLPSNPNVSMISFLLDRTRSIPYHPALVDAPTGRTLTFKDLHSSIHRVSINLRRRFGVKKGDAVLLFAPNSVEFPVAFLGIVAAGAIATTVNPLYTVQELRKQVKDSGATLVFTVPELWDKVKELQLPVVMITSNNETFVGSYASVSVLYFADLFEEFLGEEEYEMQAHDSAEEQGIVVSDQNPNKDEVAGLLYSSGTTGVNKGVMLTHTNFISTALMVMMEQDMRGEPPNVTLCFLPMFHIFGLSIVTFSGLCRGNAVVVMSKFDMDLMLGSVERFKVTYIFLVPPVMIALAKQGKVTKFDLSTLRVFISGAAPLGKDIMEEVASLYPHVDVLQGYGLTESCGIISLDNTTIASNRYGSVGSLASGVEGKVISTESLKPLPPNEPGELCFRGPNIMQGYFNNIEATTLTLDREGWLHTGDLGYFDDEGRLYIVDRIKELIKCKGFQVAPAELEGLLLSHPEILDAVVIPLPDDKAGEVPIAYVVLSPKSRLTEEDVKKFIAEQVAPFKRLRIVSFVNSVPKSAAGKILRRELIEKVRSRL